MSSHPLATLTDPAIDALFWPPARLGVGSAWYGHVPFAHWLIGAIRPRLVVELGTHNGVSFIAFCEAVRRLRLPTRCIAVDLWEGDAHAGFYGADVYRGLADFVAHRYPDIAELRRMRFAEALDGVADRSIDLLHIDGRHRYEDVQEDFESWRGKLSSRAVVLFHDICETREDFGVHRYWAEIAPSRPSHEIGFEFHHAHGLGVLLAGPDAPPAIATLCALRQLREGEVIRSRFAALGERWVRDIAAVEQDRANQALQAHIVTLQAHIQELGDYTARIEADRAALIAIRDGAEAASTPPG